MRVGELRGDVERAGEVLEGLDEARAEGVE
jgi:hypothetical protein